MLYLYRKPGQGVLIADCVCLKVLEIKERHCSLEITGPTKLVPVPQTLRLDVGESFNLDNQVEVIFKYIAKKGRACLGFEADLSITIRRLETVAVSEGVDQPPAMDGCTAGPLLNEGKNAESPEQDGGVSPPAGRCEDVQAPGGPGEPVVHNDSGKCCVAECGGCPDGGGAGSVRSDALGSTEGSPECP